MKDTLLAQRQYFDEKLEELSQIVDPQERYKNEVNLLTNESQVEFSYRSGMTRGKIIGLGLEEHMSEIIDGVNRTGQRANPSDINRYDSAKHAQTITRAHSDAMLRFGLDYVDKWVMYNHLFKQTE